MFSLSLFYLLTCFLSLVASGCNSSVMAMQKISKITSATSKTVFFHTNVPKQVIHYRFACLDRSTRTLTLYHQQRQSHRYAISRKHRKKTHYRTRWRYAVYAGGSIGVLGSLLNLQSNQKVHAESYERQITLDELWDNFELLCEQLSCVNRHNLSVFFEIGEGILEDAERMIETARLSALYLYDYVDEHKINSYEHVQSCTLEKLNVLCEQFKTEEPTFLKAFNKKVYLKKSGNGYRVALPEEALEAFLEGFNQTFIDLPGNLASFCKLVFVDIPEWLVDKLLFPKDPDFKQLFNDLKRDSSYFLTHYNRFSDVEVSPIQGVMLLQEADKILKEMEDLMIASTLKVAIGIFNPIFTLFAIEDLNKLKFFLENDELLELDKIICDLRSELGLLKVYPSIPDRLEKWWDSKSNIEKYKVLGRGLGEAILFFFGGDIFSAIIEEGSELVGVAKNFFFGGKTKTLAKIVSEASEVKAINLAKATEIVEAGGKVNRLVMTINELQDVSKVAKVTQQAKKIELVFTAVETEAIVGTKAILKGKGLMCKLGLVEESAASKLVRLFEETGKGKEFILKIQNKQNTITTIFTTGVQHGPKTKEHWLTMLHNAMKIAEKGEYSYITLNKRLSTTFRKAGQKCPTILQKIRPDIFAISEKGELMIVEIRSPSQLSEALNIETKSRTRMLRGKGYPSEDHVFNIGESIYS